MKLFNEAKERNLETLNVYVPVVARVHGGSHPEFHTVKELFAEINAKMTLAGQARPDLKSEFAKLREVTENYQVPSDVCESYEAVYRMLGELDQAYHRCGTTTF